MDSRQKAVALLGGVLACAALSGSTASARILVDFGEGFTLTPSPTNGVYWNNVGGHNANTIGINTGPAGLLSNMVDTTGAATTVDLQMTTAFQGAYGGGTTASTLYPVSAAKDTLYGYSVSPAFTLQGLDSATAYDITFYASTLQATSHLTNYTVTGTGSPVVVTLENSTTISGNPDSTVTALNITPTALGEITVQISEQAGSPGTAWFLGVMEISPVPEPTSVALLGLAGLAMLRRRRVA